MAKLRRNHRKGNNSAAMMSRLLILLLILGVFYVCKNLFSGNSSASTDASSTTSGEIDYTQNLSMLPSSKGQVINHQFYTLSYLEEYEQPEWVAYELKQELLFKPHVPRADNFRMDPLVKTKSAMREDYKRSGYSRGHLVPAGDMAFNETAMSETFFMSNMSPQKINFNGGVWRELEEQVRDWAKKYGNLYVVSGPMLDEKPIDYIGKNDVAVPAAYFKAIVDENDGDPRGIAYIIPHEKVSEQLDEFAVSIDELESRTGIDFFQNLFSEEIEEKVESTLNKKPWYFSKKRYQTRLDKWNNM